MNPKHPSAMSASGRLFRLDDHRSRHTGNTEPLLSPLPLRARLQSSASLAGSAPATDAGHRLQQYCRAQPTARLSSPWRLHMTLLKPPLRAYPTGVRRYRSHEMMPVMSSPACEAGTASGHIAGLAVSSQRHHWPFQPRLMTQQGSLAPAGLRPVFALKTLKRRRLHLPPQCPAAAAAPAGSSSSAGWRQNSGRAAVRISVHVDSAPRICSKSRSSTTDSKF